MSGVRILAGDCRAVLPTLATDSLDACVTDPPYELGFMGRSWDRSGVANDAAMWREVLRVLKPGAHLLAFGGTRTRHRMVCAVEDAGFEIRDEVAWTYGQGFPKSKNLGGEREGWGTALKPAWEPIIMARKPLSERTVEANVARWGTGAINIGACRIETKEDLNGGTYCGAAAKETADGWRMANAQREFKQPAGRWPANLIHDGSQGVLELFPETKSNGGGTSNTGFWSRDDRGQPIARGDAGSAARFFKSCEWSEDELLIWRAKSILLQWNREIALTADNHSSLSKQAVVSALSDAATSASQEGRVLQNVRGLLGLSTSVTPTELRRISEAAITTILNIESGFSPASPHERRIQNGSLARCAAACERTGTITTTISHWRSDGSVDPVTFDITPQSLVAGEAAYAPRFSYCAKASASDRAGSKHPTVKPRALMRYLCRLVTPPQGLVLDPFAGSGTTLYAARDEGFEAVGIEQEAEYVAHIAARLTPTPAHGDGDGGIAGEAAPTQEPRHG